MVGRQANITSRTAMKTLSNVVRWTVGICVGILFCFGTGLYIANIFPSFNRTTVVLTYISIYGFYTYLLIQAKLPMNDGLSTDKVAPVYSIALAIPASVTILMIVGVGKLFFVASLLIFLSITILNVIIIYQNQDIVPSGKLLEIFYLNKHKDLIEKFRQGRIIDPADRPRSEFIAELTLSIVNTSGVLTALIAFIMYKFGLLA